MGAFTVTDRRFENLIGMPREEEFGEVGFTAEDRKTLYHLEAHYSELYKIVLDVRLSLERRLDRLEQDRAHKDDLQRVEQRLTRELGEKANRTELASSAIHRLQADVEKLTTRVTWMWAYAVGIATAIAAIFHFAVPFSK